MKHIQVVSKLPAPAVNSIPVGTLVDFIIALLTAFKPILVLKYGTTTQ